MSYDLAVWDGDRPFDDRAASSTYDELYERYLESDDVAVPPAPRDLVGRLRDHSPHSASPQMVSDGSR
ncbi:hypothetical protein [Streptomyces sp. NPDC056069]|uniref:hypothetical protein n=1 Tax=Streptomyces sp. NPDC056069 TaxID=3345702 RepID=UPI0035DC2E45